jgi:hypothetical protein
MGRLWTFWAIYLGKNEVAPRLPEEILKHQLFCRSQIAQRGKYI